jgi:nicotinamidase-related amidase
MNDRQWTPLDQKRPPTQVKVALVCVDIQNGVVHALGWLDLSGEWVITAIPTDQTPIKEITHWCELPDSLPGYRKGDPWPQIER